MTAYVPQRLSRPWMLTSLWFCLALASPLAHSQTACNSDGQPAPTALFERFTNADCATCWTDANTPAARPGALTLDWIVPGSQGDDAALAAAANSDARARLASLQRVPATGQDALVTTIADAPPVALRVAHGPAVGNYMGVVIGLSLPPSTNVVLPLTGWVILLEALPAGTAGSPVPRHLVINSLQPLWNMGKQLSNQETISFNDIRAMNIAEGANTQRLRVAAWVQDAQGRILAAVQSACPPEDKD
ncbi:hypothetical protein HUU62_14225 [Rhodoferax sp. 4810]|nr:hypothetical protein [Rhodoferax jenense]